MTPGTTLDAAGITEAEYLRFCEYFYRRTGIAFGNNKRYFVDKRLVERMHATGHAGFEAYFAGLRRADAQPEIQRLTNLLTVNETYFYREDHQFHCLSDSILPEITAGRRNGDRVRIWSMPCSTGEEPYSIAIHLLENWPQVDDFDIEITASDIDTKVLAAAAEGLYDARSLQRLPPALVRRYFTTEAAGRFRLIDAIRHSVRFTALNAADPAAMRAYLGIDVIFCRNMLIYFDDKSRRQTVEAFHDSLADGGFICLGHAESMSRITPIFKARAFAQAIVYQKTGGSR